jgi:hypothetical protein
LLHTKLKHHRRERKIKLKLLASQPFKLEIKAWNSIFLPFTTSPPKHLRSKTPLSRAIFRRSPMPPNLFFSGWRECPEEKEGGCWYIYGWHL